MKKKKVLKSFRIELCSNSGVLPEMPLLFLVRFCVCVFALMLVFQMLYFWDMLAVERFKIRFLEIRLWELLATRRRSHSEHLDEVWQREEGGGAALLGSREAPGAAGARSELRALPPGASLPRASGALDRAALCAFHAERPGPPSPSAGGRRSGVPAAPPQASPREHSLAGLPGRRAPVLCGRVCFPAGRRPGSPCAGLSGGQAAGSRRTEEPRERVPASSRAE